MPLTLPYYMGAPWLPQYRGDPNTLRGFREQMRATFRMYPLSQEQQVEMLMGQLEGPALREIKSWSPAERKTVKDIFAKLQSEFEARSLSELQMRFFERRQKPGESLRDYAYSLQEAMGAIIQAEPSGGAHADRTLLERFIEGAYSENTQGQLRMLAEQHPTLPFQEFRRMAVRVLERERRPGPSNLSGSPAAAISPAIPSTGALPVIQAAQAPAPDAVSRLQEQLGSLAKTVETLCRRLDDLATRPPQSNVPENPARSVPDASPPVYKGPPARTAPDKASRPKPTCRYCHKYGHSADTCFQLNYTSPRARTTPREQQSRVHLENRSGVLGTSRPARE